MSNQGPPNQRSQPGRSVPPPISPRPPRPGRRPLVLFAVVAVVLVVAVAGGVWLRSRSGGNTAESTPTTATPKVDLSTLDVGSYDVKPREFPGPPTPEDARNIEALNLAQWVVPPPDIIPTLIYVNGLPVSKPAMAATAVSGNGTKVIQPVLEKYGMISGFLMQGFPKPVKEFIKKPEGSTVNIMVTSFPSAEKAGQAAAEMDATDFAVNPANVAVPIPGYPDAHAHYQPGIPTIAATMARKDMVVSIAFADTASNTADLLGAAVQRVLDAEAPQMDQAVSNPEAALTMLPTDPDHMLSRLLVKGPTPPIGPAFARVAGSAVVICEGSEGIQQNLFGTAGVDRCAGSPEGTVKRANDEAAAKRLLAKSFEIDTDVDHKITPPEGVPDAVCVEQKPDKWKDAPSSRFVCGLTYGRYAATVFSGEEKDVLQRAAAQYALLVNND